MQNTGLLNKNLYYFLPNQVEGSSALKRYLR